jgi:hypothetical protein
MIGIQGQSQEQSTDWQNPNTFFELNHKRSDLTGAWNRRQIGSGLCERSDTADPALHPGKFNSFEP